MSRFKRAHEMFRTKTSEGTTGDVVAHADADAFIAELRSEGATVLKRVRPDEPAGDIS